MTNGIVHRVGGEAIIAGCANLEGRGVPLTAGPERWRRRKRGSNGEGPTVPGTLEGATLARYNREGMSRE